MPKVSTHPSYTECVAQALSRSALPLGMDDLLAAVAGLRPLSKSARNAIYQAIGKLYQAVPLGDGRYGWLPALLHENIFRHTLSEVELRRGVLYLDELLHVAFAPSFFQEQRMDLRPLQVELSGESERVPTPILLDRRIWALRFGPKLAAWVDGVGGQPGDDLIIAVEDAQEGRYALRLQPREMRDQDVLDQRNLVVAQAAEAILIQDRKMRTVIPVWDLAALLIGQGHFCHPIPPDELHMILAQYSTLQYHRGAGYALPGVHLSDPALGMPGLERLSPRAVRFLAEEFDAFGYDSNGDSAGLPSLLFGPEEGEEGDLFDDGGVLAYGEDQADLPCSAYQIYVDIFLDVEPDGTPLGHEEYHLYEAELDNLAGMEYEFGYLLPDQEARKIQLCERLFIDPDTIVDGYDVDGYDDDMDTFDVDGPPFWQN